MSERRENPTPADQQDVRHEKVHLDGNVYRTSYKVNGPEAQILQARKIGDVENQQDHKGHRSGATGQPQSASAQQEVPLTSQELKNLQEHLEKKTEREHIEVKKRSGETPTLNRTHVRQEREKIYDEKISPDIKGNSQTKKPTLVILAGQGGSGKSDLTRQQKEKLEQQGQTVVVDPDELRKHSPNYASDIRADSRTAANKANVGDWTKELFTEALANKQNIVLDGTAGNIQSMAQRVALARAAGYRIEVHAVAANGIDSWLGILQRHEQGLQKDKMHPDQEPQARYVPKSAHDQSAAGITGTLGYCEHNGLVDSIKVYARGRYDKPIYTNDDVKTRQSLGAAEAFEQERNRSRSAAELQTRAETVKYVEGLMKARGASPQEIAEVRQVAYEGKNKGFSNVADTVSKDRRPEISADTYIKDPSARQEFRAQAEQRIDDYLKERTQQGTPKEKLERIASTLRGKLNDPAKAYSLKEGLELRELRKGLETTTSVSEVRDFYAKFDRVSSDVSRVHEAFGTKRTQATDPKMIERAQSNRSWKRAGQESRAALRDNVEKGHVKPENYKAEDESIKKDYDAARRKSLHRRFDRTEHEVNAQKQAGASSNAPRPSTGRHYRRMPQEELAFV